MDLSDASPTPQHAVPRFDPLEGAGELPVATSHPTRRSRHSDPATLPYGDDPWEQRLLVAAVVTAVIVAIALVLVSR